MTNLFTTTLTVPIPQSTHTKTLNVTKCGKGEIHLSTNKPTPLPEKEARAIAELIEKTLEGSKATVSPYYPPLTVV